MRAPSSAQCIVKLDEIRIAVFTPAISFGSSVPSAGHGSFCTTRKKKYAVKNAPKSMISEMMKSSIPRNWASTREDWLAAGGPWWSPWPWSPAAIVADSIRRSPPRAPRTA